MHIALAPFALKASVPEDALLHASDRFDKEFASHQEGTAKRFLVKDGDNGGYADLVFFRDLGSKVSQHTDVPVASGTELTSSTPSAVADAQRQLSMLQWAVPVLTGALVIVSVYAGEQQRPGEVHKGFVAGITG